MSARSRFDATIKRSNDLINLTRDHTHFKLPAEVSRDLCRSALLLAVGAMDAYFTSRFSEHLVPFLKSLGATQKPRIPDDLVKLLSDGGLDVRTSLELLTMRKPYRRIRTIVDDHLKKETTQRPHKIDALFRCYGIAHLSANAAKRSQRKKLLESVAWAVNRRNEIAHDGDMNLHNRTRPIEQGETVRRIADIVLYVSKCEEIIDNAISNNIKKHSRKERVDTPKKVR